MHPIFAERLGLVVGSTNVGTQKIDGITLETYGMVVAVFSMTNQAKRVKFFKETFLMANVSPDVILEMPFFTLSGANIDFPKRELWLRSYTIEKVLSTTKRVELVKKKKFAATALDSGHETFIIHIASLECSNQKDGIYSSYIAQIAALVANEAFTSISIKYSKFVDVFLRH